MRISDWSSDVCSSDLLLCGAEGTLGIVTAACLRLVPVAAARATAWVGLTSPDAALALLRRLDAALGRQLEGFEIIPHRCLDAVLRHIPQTRAPLDPPHPWYALVELAGGDGDNLDAKLVAELAAEIGRASCRERGCKR